jgi:16S rRNA (cytosine1402-N4)-methyltransferase
MLAEVLQHLSLRPGDTVVDATLGGGGHARTLLQHIAPGGRLLGLDLDRDQLQATESALREEGFGADVLTVAHANFSTLPETLAAQGLITVDAVLVDLGISSMQKEESRRGFNYKMPGPLDMRLDQTEGPTAADIIAQSTEDELAALLVTNSDEPLAGLVARLLKSHDASTTHAVERIVRTGIAAAHPALSKSEVKMSVRRTFQALRIAVNDELRALSALLDALPRCLAPGGRIAILTFHSGEDRIVKKAFRAGQRAGLYARIATEVVRSSQAETYANRRAQAAKLRWATRGRHEDCRFL